MKKLTLFLSALAFFTASRALALELSLEENKGESGTIGYVDIDRVFKNFSGTSNAREEFLDRIKKKEDALNIKKQAIFSLKADIAKLKQEREFALTLPGLMRQAEEISAAAAKAAEIPIPQISTQIVPVQLSPGEAQSNFPTTDTPNGPQPAVVPLPPASGPEAPGKTGPANSGVSMSTAAVQLSTQTIPAVVTNTAGETAGIGKAAAASSSTLTSPPPSPLPALVVPPPGLPGMTGIDMPGISRVPMDYFKFSISTSAAEIDSAIVLKETELAKKEEGLRLSQHQTERELLEFENNKSEIILGRIYLVLKELAVKEGVSVVVDKRTILFGHSAVDLTDKLVKKLEESPI